jgi:hypothetical protein
MNKPRISFQALTLCLLLLAAASFARAQSSRTFVSGVGDDNATCSRTAPCKTFAGALSKTVSGGEIDALDPGGYGVILLTKPITIDGTGTFASILSSSATAITINISAPGADDNVILRGLRINGGGTPGNFSGIRYLSANSVVVRDCRIFNCGNFGIDVAENTGSFLAVRDTDIENCINGGISVTAASGTMRAQIENSTVFGCTFGFRAGINSNLTISDSSASGCGNAGFLADGTSAVMNMKNCTTTNNVNGVRSDNSAIIRVSGSQIVNNITAGYLRNGGFIESYANNEVRGNPTNSGVTQVGQS